MGSKEDRLHIDVITPEKLATEMECSLAVLPTAGGEVGVEDGHAHMMATLVPGEMRLYEGEQSHVYAISGGVVDTRPKRLVVMADAVEPVAEIDVQRAHRARERAEKRLQAHAEGVDLDRAQAALARAINRIRVGTTDEEDLDK